MTAFANARCERIECGGALAGLEPRHHVNPCAERVLFSVLARPLDVMIVRRSRIPWPM